jgi:hypothetical protein
MDDEIIGTIHIDPRLEEYRVLSASLNDLFQRAC